MTKGERHIAARKLITPEGILEMGVADLSDGIVRGWHSLSGEEPFTEWIKGTIIIKGVGQEPHFLKE